MQDASNWGDSTPGARGKHVPCGPLCRACKDFGKDANMTADDIVRESKAKVLKQQLKKDMQGYRDYENAEAEGKALAQPYRPREVKLTTDVTSSIEMRMDIVERQRFHDQHEVWPEDCKLMQVEDRTGWGDEVHGIVVEDPSIPKQLVVTRSHTITMDDVILASDSNKFENHATRIFEQQTASAMKTLGLSSGDKYVAKKKTTERYTMDKVEAAVLQARIRLGVDASDPLHLPTRGQGAQQNRSSSVRPSVMPSPRLQQTSGSGAGLLALENGGSDACPSLQCGGPCTDCDESLADDEMFAHVPGVEQYSTCRVKPPGYWLLVFKVENIDLVKQSPTKQMNFARACVNRCEGSKDPNVVIEVAFGMVLLGVVWMHVHLFNIQHFNKAMRDRCVFVSIRGV